MPLTRRAFLAAPAIAVAASPKPNIVLIMSDDMGSADLSSYGAADIRTPNIDSIGRQGVRFTNAYCNAPECTPSRTALLTGRYQQRVGGLECALGVGNVGRYDEAIWLRERNQMGLPAEEITIARMLRNAGYDTACSGKWHLGYTSQFSPNAHGFDEYFGILGGNADYYRHTEEDGTNVLYHNGKPVEREGYLTDLIGQHAVDWLKHRSAKPFFLYVPFSSPHSPYQSHAVKDIPPGGYNRGSRKIYAEMVEAMDAQVGAILNQLDRTGAGRNTWVIFLSDNGGTNIGSNKPYRGFKSSVWEGGIRTAGLMRWPGVFRPASETAQLTLMMDITAAIAAAAGAKPPRKLDGEDLLPYWKGEKPPKPRTVFWRYRRAENTRQAVRHGDWKLVIDNGDESLHNIATDPGEKHNLLAQEPSTAADLRARLAAWDKEVRAPRLKQFYAARGK
ncbi:MAG: sulfatase-like hydrolase/transferase [Bryobacterales bacterium]|nr:sulfatase-like hydrolase/transferase [Bryobacterales bacterium]